MGQQVSIETLSAKDEDEGSRYWTSFEPYPHRVGRQKLSYLGLLNGHGPRKGEKCLVKAFRYGCATHDDWEGEILKAKEAKYLSKAFAKEMKMFDRYVRLVFRTPMLAEIDEVSSFMCVAFLMGKPRKKMKELEIVAIEPYFKGHFQNFESDKTDFTDTVMLNAFSHYTWCKSKGEFVICKFQGVKQMDTFYLTVPTIHSRSRVFGRDDLGTMGIDSFFANHQCNEICRLWERPDRTLLSEKISTSEIHLLDMHMQNFVSRDSVIDKDNGEFKSFFVQSRYPFRHTVHCNRPNSCACDFFRLPCPHGIERKSGLMFAINRSFSYDK